MRRLMLMILALGLVLIGTSALAKQPAGTSDETARAAFSPTVIRVQTWDLLQSDGAELYAELCATCHGAQGTGNGPIARALTVHPPPLTNLTEMGIAREHWLYVIESSCDDPHHLGPTGLRTMPCWQRAFRQALGSDAASLMVSTRLVNYLESIQEIAE